MINKNKKQFVKMKYDIDSLYYIILPIRDLFGVCERWFNELDPLERSVSAVVLAVKRKSSSER